MHVRASILSSAAQAGREDATILRGEPAPRQLGAIALAINQNDNAMRVDPIGLNDGFCSFNWPMIVVRFRPHGGIYNSAPSPRAFRRRNEKTDLARPTVDE